MKILHLNLKKKYFQEIKECTKLYEHRLVNDYWRKRLEKNNFDKILIKLGYPKKNDFDRIIERPYHGYIKHEIQHPEFGPYPVKVYSILVNIFL